MAPRRTEKGKKKSQSSAGPPPAVEPAVGQSLVLNQEAMDKVRPALTADFKEWGRTAAWPASRASVDRTTTKVQFFIDALWAGLVPPFSAFFNAVLSHYQIHMLHPDPQSVFLLAIFAFVCEAMVGIPPSVALLCHFFSLHLTDPRQCSACLSFQVVATTASSGIDFELPPSASGSRTRWVFMDIGVLSPLLSPPLALAVPSSGWGHEKLAETRLAFI